MLVFDASTLIHVWDNYPQAQFPKLWSWISSELQNGTAVVPDVALTEAGHKSPESVKWLKANGLVVVPTPATVLVEAVRIKALLGIVGDNYGRGVDENDLIVIATARIQNGVVVTEEAVQLVLPQNLSNTKIPGVCAHPAVSVKCVNFTAVVKQSKMVFG